MKKNILLIIAILCSFFAQAQNQPVLAIDGVNTTFQSGLSLPYWLKAGQTLNVVANASSVSIMEFTVDSNTLKYSRVISLNSLQTVPTGKIWKIEAIGSATIGGTVGFTNTSMPTIFTSPKTFDTPGIYSWTVPPNVTSICIEVWGGGGSGGYGASSSFSSIAGGGGGGGYGYQCFTVVPGTIYTVTVGGASGTSSLGSLISATGGSNGIDATNNNPYGAGGIGGTSTATFNIAGANGNTGGSNGNATGTGGAGANGGLGAINPSAKGTAPGGGGGGAQYTSSIGLGAPGQVIIYW
jgi:hypothetical protein